MTIWNDPVVGASALLLVAAVMGGAALHKLRDGAAFRETVRDYRLLPDALAATGAVLVVLAEIAAVGLLLVPVTRSVGAILAGALLVLYAGAIGINLARGRTEIDCGCTWSGSGQTISAWLLLRNAALLPFAYLAGAEWADRAFGLAEEWGRRGAEIDPECAECVLYQFAGLARFATTRGILQSAGSASEIAELLDRALELGPTHKDADWNNELANLYFAAGIFYRSVPEGQVIEWTIGVQGDRRRALDYLKKAVEVSPNRVDFRVELGAMLLCLGSRESNDAQVAAGKAALASVKDLPTYQKNDPIDRAHALMLAAEPDEACGYDRDGGLAEGKGPAR